MEKQKEPDTYSHKHSVKIERMVEACAWMHRVHNSKKSEGIRYLSHDMHLVSRGCLSHTHQALNVYLLKQHEKCCLSDSSEKFWPFLNYIMTHEIMYQALPAFVWYK